MSLATVSSEKSLGKSLSYGESSAVVRRRSVSRGSLNPQRYAGPRAVYAGAYSKGENSPYLPLWSYANPSSVTRYVLVAHNSCVLDVNPVGL